MSKEEWEARQKEREQKQKEWEARQQEREKKQKEYEERLKLREKKNKDWENKVNSSKSHLDTIMSMVRSAQPVSTSSSGLGDMILCLATGGLSTMMQGLLGERDALNQRSSHLSSCSNKLRQAREYFSKNKENLIGEDKSRAYSAISEVQETLNAYWAELKDNKQKLNESLQRAREEKERERAAKQAAWEERQRVNAEKKRIYEEKQKAYEERKKIQAEKQKAWEAKQKERDAKQKEWEERKRERERKQKEWEDRQRERERIKEQKQREWEARQRERERRQSEWEERQRERERRQSERQSRSSYSGRSGGGGGRSGGGKKKDCYLTTACVTAQGLPDNCYELSILRSFRDEYLLSFNVGKEAVREYYKLAPSIVSKVNKHQDSDKIWELVYQDIIIAVKLIESGQLLAAFEHYKKMTYSLKNT